MEFKSLIVAVAMTITGCTTTTPFTGPDPQKVIEVDAKASDIYQGARQWIAENFRSSDAVIQYEDDATNTVIGRGSLPDSVCKTITHSYVPAAGQTGCLNYTSAEFVMKIEAKDSRMRITLPSVNYIVPRTAYIKGGPEPASQELMDALSIDILQMGDEIAAYVTEGTTDSSW